jgi:hypothetical protein
MTGGVAPDPEFHFQYHQEKEKVVRDPDTKATFLPFL